MKTESKVFIGVATAVALLGGFLLWKHHSSKKAAEPKKSADGQYENFTWPWNKKKSTSVPTAVKASAAPTGQAVNIGRLGNDATSAPLATASSSYPEVDKFAINQGIASISAAKPIAKGWANPFARAERSIGSFFARRKM